MPKVRALYFDEPNALDLDVRYYVVASRPVDRTTNLRSDQSIRLNGTDAPKHWPSLLRRDSLYDFEHSRRLAFAPTSESARRRFRV